MHRHNFYFTGKIHKMPPSVQLAQNDTSSASTRENHLHNSQIAAQEKPSPAAHEYYPCSNQTLLPLLSIFIPASHERKKKENHVF